MHRLIAPLVLTASLLAGCANTSLLSLTTPAEPGTERAVRVDLTRPTTEAERKGSIILVHNDATQLERSAYRLLNPTGADSVRAGALSVCKRIDRRYSAAQVLRFDGPPEAHVGRIYYFSCI